MRTGVIRVSLIVKFNFLLNLKKRARMVLHLFLFFSSSGKILTPKMTELLEPMDDIDLAVVDVDSNIDLVNTFEVKAVPAVLAFRNGVVVDKFIGLVDSTMIENLISKLKKKKEI